MELVFAMLVGGLYAAGLYMVMQRSLVRVIIGLALLGHAANVLIFVTAGVTPGRAPIIEQGTTTVVGAADPLPQALILTAIVIGFAVLAYFLVLAQRAYAVAETEDLDALRSTDT